MDCRNRTRKHPVFDSIGSKDVWPRDRAQVSASVHRSGLTLAREAMTTVTSTHKRTGSVEKHCSGRYDQREKRISHWRLTQKRDGHSIKKTGPIVAGLTWPMPKCTRPCRNRDSEQNQHRASLEGEQKYSTEKKKWSLASRAKLCQVQTQMHYQSLQGRKLHGSDRKRGKKEKNERMG